MFHRRWSKDDTGSPWRGKPEEKDAVPRRRWLRVGTLLATVAAVAVLACSDDRRSTGPAEPDNIADRLRANADAFHYTIGKPGGSLTTATISEPLTLNLAIANDASSTDVLGYLFEGLTETSWLTDEVSRRWHSPGRIRRTAWSGPSICAGT